jgi:4-amino-4-deoxy-L-arabinose transferase-like glycosyltransferase
VTSITQAPLRPVKAVARVKGLAPTAVFATTFALGLGFSLRLLNPADESWFVQVIARMRAGDVLYRDIAYGAGPLPAYATAGLTYVTGVDVLAVKLVVVLAFAGSATIAWLIAEELGLGAIGGVLVVLGLTYLAPPLQQPPYPPLAGAFLLLTLLFVLRARSGATRTAITMASLAAGAAAALAFASKQNVGVYALAALVVTFLVERRWRSCLFALGSFGFVGGIMLGLLWLSGALGRYLDYGFTGKGAYVHAQATFSSETHGVLQALRDVHSLASAEAEYWALGFFLPCLALVGFLALVAMGRRAPQALPILTFAAASGATLFPRFDAEHVAFAAPALVLLLAYAVHRWRSRARSAVLVAVAAWTGIAVVLMATLPLRLARSPSANVSTLPHLRGAFVQEDDSAHWLGEAARLRSAAHEDASLLLLVPDAGFRYLTAGLQNPTPFDFPLVTTFGRDGQRRVVDDLASGQIQRVCMAPISSDLEPTQIVTYVRATMRAEARLGFCTLYERKP